MGDGSLERSEVEAALAARRDLGAEYDDAFVQAFADRIEQVVAERSSAAVAQRHLSDEDTGGRQLVIGIVSLGTGIPITAIAGATADLPGIIVAWVGIVGVNVAHALSTRRR